jgi:hypothetical protein
VWSRIVFASAVSGWISLVGGVGGAWAQGRPWHLAADPTMAERTYLADYCTIYEGLERVALDGGLAIKLSGMGSAWETLGGLEMRAKELFAVVADEQKFPFLGSGLDSHFCYIGRFLDDRPLDDRRRSELRKIRLDLDTGDLRGPDGVDLEGLRILRVKLTFTLMSEAGAEVCKIHVHRKFPDKQLKVSISSRRNDMQASCRDLLASLESKLELASKLRQAKEKRRREGKHEARESLPAKPN